MFLFSHSGCFSYRILKQIDGSKTTPIAGSLEKNVTTLTDALDQYGAPRRIQLLNNHMVLIYHRAVTHERELSFNIPLYQMIGGYDISASGGLQRNDVLALWFNDQGILDDFVFEQESENPFIKTLFQD